MGDISLFNNLLLIVLLLSGSAFFCFSEGALFALSRHQRETMAKEGGRNVRLIERLLKDPYRLIVTILFADEVANVAYSSVIGLTVQRFMSDTPEQTLTLISLAIASPSLLLIGEIGPKTVAVKFPRVIGKAVATPLYIFHMAIAPIRWILMILSIGFTKIFGVDSNRYEQHKAFTAEELEILVGLGSEEGVLNEVERNLAERFFKLEDVTANKIMTQNIDCFTLSINTTIEKAVYEIKKRGYSRTPVYSEDRDNIVGILYSKDLLTADINKKDLKTEPIENYLKKPYFIPRTKLAYDLLKEFQTKRTHMSIVVDEYGRFDGLVTMEDILEELFGEIEDERRVIKKSEVSWDEEALIVPGNMKIDEFNENYLFTVLRFGGLSHLAETLEESVLPSEEHHETIGGLVFDLFGRFPMVEEQVSYGGLTFTVNQVMKKRLSEIKIEYIDKEVADVA